MSHNTSRKDHNRLRTKRLKSLLIVVQDKELIMLVDRLKEGDRERPVEWVGKHGEEAGGTAEDHTGRDQHHVELRRAKTRQDKTR